jgi:hypothetical protein
LFKFSRVFFFLCCCAWREWRRRFLFPEFYLFIIPLVDVGSCPQCFYFILFIIIF